MKKYFTTALAYLNGKPHIGHAYEFVLTDALHRYYKIFGNKSILLTGTDEHGEKVMTSAQNKGQHPQEYCDEIVIPFKDMMNKLHAQHDIFYRTTDPIHKQKVQQVMQHLYEKGDIYKGMYTGNYCTPCETFYTEKDLVDGKCPECGRETKVIEEENYFFNMPKYAEKLEKHILENKDFVFPDYRRNETLGILKKGLVPLCVSRKKEKMNWGIELPFDKDYVCWVWFDALTNYLFGIGYPDNMEKYQDYWPTVTHIVGKDILMFHTINWPCMLMSLDLPVPKNIIVHGHILAADGQKMSKSLGNSVNPDDIVNKYGTEAFRFYILREMSLGLDGRFNEKFLVDRHNTELANDFGNLLNRATHLISKTFAGAVPEVTGQTAYCADFIEDFNKTLPLIEELLYKFELNRVLDEVMRLIRSTNKYLENTAPWHLLKTDLPLTGSVLYNALEAFRICSVLLSPVIPGKFEEIKKIFPSGFDYTLKFGSLQAGTKINKSEPLFPRIEAVIEEAVTPVVKDDGLIDITEFDKVQIKTVKILKAENVEGSDRLLYCDVDFGHEKRKIVAGIAKFYKPEEITGLHVLAVANLKPAEIRGLKSEGMLLSIKAGKNLRLVTIDKELPLGKTLC